MNIGFCGTGRMGAAMCLHLMENKHKLTVWNRTARKAKPVVKAGATQVQTPAGLFAENDIVINIVIDDKAAKTAYESRDGLLSANLKGKLVVEMSTLMPDTTKALEAKVQAKGGTFLECPVGGSVPPPAPAICSAWPEAHRQPTNAHSRFFKPCADVLIGLVRLGRAQP